MENRNFLVLDGGLGSALIRAGFDIDEDPLWGGKVLIENPDAVKTIHKSFLLSGANVVITNTYQVTIEGLCQHYGLNQSEAVSVIYKAVKIARDACDEVHSTNVGCQEKLLVAGSVGPYGACLHDRSEYTGDYVDSMTIQELMDWHRPRIDALLQAGVDILAMETIPAQKEAEALVQLLKEFPTAKAWLTLSCRDGSHTCRGEMFSDVVQNVVRQSTQSLLQSIKGKVDLPFVVYPNSGEMLKDGTGLLSDEARGHSKDTRSSGQASMTSQALFKGYLQLYRSVLTRLRHFSTFSGNAALKLAQGVLRAQRMKKNYTKPTYISL
ncbi:homocysteine S-methyltransferase-like isoform X2 [Porites lutea]|uniref:homocysteine S-methyltransferase-like isoform X2 n=1 Tax=Porites lutea TaxID=51062 RepID=UPI003CC61BFB